MTIAVDRTNGKVLGQIVSLHPAAPMAAREGEVNVFYRGEYLRIPADSVRVEEVR